MRFDGDQREKVYYISKNAWEALQAEILAKANKLGDQELVEPAFPVDDEKKKFIVGGSPEKIKKTTIGNRLRETMGLIAYFIERREGQEKMVEAQFEMLLLVLEVNLEGHPIETSVKSFCARSFVMLTAKERAASAMVEGIV